MTDTTPFRPTIRTQSDLHRAWQRLMSPLGFSGHSIWLMVIAPDGRPLPQLIELTEADLPDGLAPADFARLLRRVQETLPEPVRFAFLRSRPGAGVVTAEDRAWAGFLYDAARLADAPVEVVHRASDHDIVPVPYDELLDAPA